MRRLNKFIALPFKDQCLLVEAVVLTALARLTVAGMPFRWIAHYLGRHMAETPHIQCDADHRTVKRIQWAIQVAVRHTPWSASCLTQAVAATFMLRRRRIDGTVYLGVAKNEQTDITAHAWLRSGTIIVTGADGLDGHSVISTFAFDQGGRPSKRRRFAVEKR